MIRAFLGLALPPAIMSALTVQQFLLPLPRRTPPEQFHLTLVFLGEVSEPVLEAAHEGFARLMVQPLTLSLAGMGLFGGERPRAVWAGLSPAPGLLALQARAERVARQAGCPVPSRRFHPHVTLGQFPPPPRDVALRLERAVAEASGFAAGPWQVRAMTLWQSHLGPKGARHDILAEYPAGGG